MKTTRKRLFSLVLFISFLQISNIAFSQSINNHNSVELTETWKYRWGESPLNEVGTQIWIEEDTLRGSEWKSVEYNKGILNPPERQGEKILWLSVNLPEGKWRDPHIFIGNVRFASEIYFDNHLIYQTEGMNEPGIHNIIPVWHLVPIESEFKNRTLFFKIYSDDLKSIGIEDVTLGSKSDFIKNMVGERIQLIIFGFIFIVTGLIPLLIFIKKREKVYFAFGLFAISIGFWAISDSIKILQLFFDMPKQLFIMFFTFIFLTPVGLCLYFEQIFGAGFKSIIRRLWQVHLIYTIVALVILIFDLFPVSILENFSKIFFILFFVTLIVLLSTSITASFKGSTDARIISAGFVVFAILGIYDIIGGGFGLISSWTQVIYPWGMLVFILSLGLVLERRFSEAHKQLKEYSKDLEIKVAERTKDLYEKNEALEKTLSELKLTQSQLVQSEKMASLGQLTAGVAHEINNPIGAINSNIDLNESCLVKIKKLFGFLSKRKDLEATGKLEHLIGVLEKNNETSKVASDRIIEIVNSLKNFARLDESDYQKVDIHEGLESTLTLLSPKLKDKIKIIKDYGKITPVNCYPNQLNQVFMNIISNAILAIKNEGSITIKTEVNNSTIKISIKDTGIGISNQDKEKIFDPFFTTREIGEGRGLGLSVSLGIIEKHNGNIEFISETNKGSEFIIILPVK